MVILRKLRRRGLEDARYGFMLANDPIPVNTDDAVIEPGTKNDPVFVAKLKRHEDIITKFHFRTLPEWTMGGCGHGGSSLSLRSTGSGESGGDWSNPDLECPASPGSVRRRLQKQKRRSTLSFWRRQARKDECCICLENYGAGDTICVPITKECNHIFHDDCVIAWLQHNNRCPLCRVDLLKEVKLPADDLPPLSPARTATRPATVASSPAATAAALPPLPSLERQSQATAPNSEPSVRVSPQQMEESQREEPVGEEGQQEEALPNQPDLESNDENPTREEERVETQVSTQDPIDEGGQQGEAPSEQPDLESNDENQTEDAGTVIARRESEEEGQQANPLDQSGTERTD